MSNVPGAWRSPLTATVVTSGARALAEPIWDRAGRALWLESRADEDGLVALMCLDASGPTRLSLPGLDIGSRVYGMGGGEVVPLPGGDVLVVAEDDQRWWRIGPDGGCLPVTAPTGGATRFADGVLGPDGRLWCVREVARDGGEVARDAVEPAHDLVAIDLRGDLPTPRTVVRGPDFVAAPRPSPDGTLLAWTAWDHPHMPWDEARLLVAPVRTDGTVGEAVRVAGGAGTAPQQPRWLADGTLLHLVDPDGWWNPAVWEPRSGRTRRLSAVAREFAEPPWQLGARSAGELALGDLVVASTRGAVTQLGVVPRAGLPPGRAPHPLPVPLTYLPGAALAVRGDDVLTVAAFADRPAALTAVHVDRAPDGTAAAATWRELRSSRSDIPGPEWRPAPVVVTVEGPSGPLDAVYHPPPTPITASSPASRHPWCSRPTAGPRPGCPWPTRLPRRSGRVAASRCCTSTTAAAVGRAGRSANASAVAGDGRTWRTAWLPSTRWR